MWAGSVCGLPKRSIHPAATDRGGEGGSSHRPESLPADNRGGGQPLLRVPAALTLAVARSLVIRMMSEWDQRSQRAWDRAAKDSAGRVSRAEFLRAVSARLSRPKSDIEPCEVSLRACFACHLSHEAPSIAPRPHTPSVRSSVRPFVRPPTDRGTPAIPVINPRRRCSRWA